MTDNTTTTRIITDEWAAQHLPLTSVALAAAVPIIEAEVRERIAQQIETAVCILRPDATGSEVFKSTQALCARIARGSEGVISA